MKIQVIQQENINNKQNPQFKAGDAFLRYLATNQAVGANAVDLGFMVIPRTATDLINRGPDAGAETARREASGTVNHTLIGVYGMGAGALTAALMGINKKYGADVNTIMVAPETLTILAENKARELGANKTRIDYIKETLSNLRAFNPTKSKASDGFVAISETTIDEIAKIIDSAINEGKSFKDWKKSGSGNSFDAVINKIIERTGAESKYVLTSVDDAAKKSEASIKTFIEDIFKVSSAFEKAEVKKAFAEQIKNNKGVAENEFIKSLTKFSKIKSAAGFAIATGVGMSIQPINIYLTKLKTGSDGFVGVEGREKDKSAGFFGLKCASAAAFFGMVLATLGGGIKDFMNKMAFKGFWPTIPQLKGIYGLTIISRIMATRDKDELREALTKDTLGFLSWLVLGDFVNKITAEGLDKSVMNRTKDMEKEGFFKRVFKSSLKTRDEILIETLAEHNIKSTKVENGKVVAKKFKELMGDLDKIPAAAKEKAKRRMGTLNKAQLAGYLFSGLVLGLGIPNLNIYITNKLDKKRKEKAAEEAQKQQAMA